MATWQPPIPSGALYSPAAIALGPGLALLAWCYDQIERDGSVQVQLEKAAADLGKPYGTVRDWWKDMKGSDEKPSPFFSEAIPQGRKGWRVKFKPKWIDWRINDKNYPDRRDFSDETENTADIPAVSEEKRDISGETENDAPLSDFSSRFDRRDLSDETSGNKVLMITDQASSVRSPSANGTHPASKPKSRDPTPEQKALNECKKAIEQAYVTELGYTPSAFGKEAKSAKWLAEQGYTPEQVIKCYQHLQQDDFYARQHISLVIISKQIGAVLKHKDTRNGTANGRIRQNPREHIELAKWSEDTGDAPV